MGGCVLADERTRLDRGNLGDSTRRGRCPGGGTGEPPDWEEADSRRISMIFDLHSVDAGGRGSFRDRYAYRMEVGYGVVHEYSSVSWQDALLRFQATVHLQHDESTWARRCSRILYRRAMERP